MYISYLTKNGHFPFPMLVYREGHVWLFQRAETQDMKNFKISALRRCVGYVGQEIGARFQFSPPVWKYGATEDFFGGNFRRS